MTISLLPRDESELVAAVAEAAAGRTPLAIEGASTRAAVGRPAQAERALSTRALSGILALRAGGDGDPRARRHAASPRSRRRWRRRADAALRADGTTAPSWAPPANPPWAVLSATNASGPRRLVAGACRDSLIGVRMVNGRGETVVSGGRVMKNVTGLDLARAQCAGRGARSPCSPMPPSRCCPLARDERDRGRARPRRRGRDPRDGGRHGLALRGERAAHLPSSVERVPKTLLLRIEGFAASVAYRAGRLRALLKPWGAADMMDAAASIPLWRAVRDAAVLAEPREAALWRVSVAPSRAAAAMEGLVRAAPVRHVFDWAGGLVWIALPADGDAGAALVRGALRRHGRARHARARPRRRPGPPSMSSSRRREPLRRLSAD